MSENRHSPIAEALRKAGYLPLPRLWVRAKDMEKIHAIAHKAKDVVNSIRGEVRKQHGDLPYDKPEPGRKPKNNRDAAWEAYEKMRK